MRDLKVLKMFLMIFFLLFGNILFGGVTSVIVKTHQGPLRGESLRAATGDFNYFSFKGIPYAKPPVGELRFVAPQPPECWSGIRNATQHGSICLQNSLFNTSAIYGDEINVYTPNVKPKNLLTVMLFIHGGGFARGSGNTESYGPDYLITENVVLVTINYRLGALGFLCLNTKEVPGNAGLKDQVAAMKWVQKNIANFGGDPNKVTIFGQSVGGACVGLHNLSPMTKGLYKRSIAMSGVAINDWALPFEQRRVAFKLAQQLGFWAHDDQELLTYFKSLKAEELVGKIVTILRAETPSTSLKQLTYPPVVETDFGGEHFLNTDPIQVLKCGKIHDVQLMLGHTTMEGLVYYILLGNTLANLYTNYTEMVVPRKILLNIPPANMFTLADKIHLKYFGDNPIKMSLANEFVKYMSESAFNYDIAKYAKMFAVHRDTFMYKFSRVTNFPRSINLDNEYGINGSTHNDDLAYLFYPHGLNITNYKNTDDYKVLKNTCALYTNFAKHGNPTPTNSLGVQWPKYDGHGYYLDIDKNLTVGQHLDAETVKFWDSIYEAAGLGF